MRLTALNASNKSKKIDAGASTYLQDILQVNPPSSFMKDLKKVKKDDGMIKSSSKTQF